MKLIPLDRLILRDSFLLPFRGGEIWAVELDSLSVHTELAMEKFEQDIRYAQRPSTTSLVAIHLTGTELDDTVVRVISGALGSSNGTIRRVALIGVGRREKKELSLRLEQDAAGITWAFFQDYEKAKEWLVS